MFEKIYVRKWWVVLSIFAVIALAGIAVGYINDTGPASIVGLIKQDGTPAHPYADANQCPPNTDIVILPEEWRSIPSIPKEFAVCFVEGLSK